MAHPNFLTTLPLAPKDPILGITEAFQADTNPAKINLGVGVYGDEDGKLPLLHSVSLDEDQLNALKTARGYQPIDGMVRYTRQVQQLVFGADCPALIQRRLVTAQSLGGTGALKLGADLLRSFSPQSEVWISNPSWENHRALFEAAGFTVRAYPYYQAERHGLDFEGLVQTIDQAPSGTILVLHACCHNPTGIDLDDGQWHQVRQIILRRGLIPFLDLAYQGFSQGTQEDARQVREFTELGIPVLVANSFSKSFSLYGERVGALSIVCTSSDEALRVQSQLKRVIRTNYSSPPTFGASLVATVLEEVTLHELWEKELGAMRQRIKAMRAALVTALKQTLPTHSFDYIAEQRGMFSYSGLSSEQVQRLRQEFSIYAVDSGRICIAALNHKNLERVVEAMTQVMR